MKLTTLLVVLLSNQGYWFGGREGTINIRPAARGGLPAAVISWELMLDHARLADGKAPLAGHDGETTIRITPPEVRTRVTLHWTYHLSAADTGKELDRGDVALHVFPDDLVTHLAERLDRKNLIVWDRVTGLPTLLDRAKVAYSCVEGAGDLQVADADVVLVGPGAIGDSPFGQAPLLALAESGASVMIFRQTRPQVLMGYPLSLRDVPQKLDWRTDHPLLRDLGPDDLHSWITDVRQLNCVRLPADEPALEIGYYPREVAGEKSAPIDAMLLTKTVGKGRIVLCQIPLGDWVQDPRSQILLRNAIDYLLTRPQPTPRPSERPTTQPLQQQLVPTIPVSPGS